MYSDEGLVAELDATGTVMKSYGYKPNSTWTTDPLFMKVGTDYYFYHNDHLGTPHKITTISGAIVWSAKYSSFGEATIDADSTITNNLRLPGQYYDQETGLHYNWHRYYDPGTGRYLSKDIISEMVNRSNTYLYTRGNPIDGIDPYGLMNIEMNNCTEKSRKQIPGYSSADPLYSYILGTRIVCSKIVVEDTLTCVCIGHWEEIITQVSEKYFSYEVTYRCCEKEECGKEHCREVTRIETEGPYIESKLVYKGLPEKGEVIRHGYTTAAFGGCSACIGGVGAPM